MKKDVFEIRIHGRGGQGGKTAAQFIAEAAMKDGKQIQAFPDYGPERTGAPVNSYVRISDEKIRLYQPIRHPDVVLVIDPTLPEVINVTEGLEEEGILVVNTTKTPEEIKKELNFEGKVYTVDATKISIDVLGANRPNTPILGAFAKVTGVVPIASIEDRIKAKFLKKIGEEKTQANIESVRRAYNEVR
ncbi:MAG: 2-oxoacid:acceptor oxidoreductase family protein [Candidatus Altiarchaeota archaeon]|nr:2-oxoacid:acceptor oxidoreductase family protein [Candidatus Altiarchaeota archaeon]